MPNDLLHPSAPAAATPAAEPSAPRKTGAARFFELLGRDLWPFYKASLLCCLGFLPGFAGVVFGLLAGAPGICLAAGLAGGLLAAPFYCGLQDTLLRALRDEPGYWWVTYKAAWRQNWRGALLPGGVAGLLLGGWAYALRTLPAMAGSTPVPTMVWVCVLVSIFLAAGYFTYYFAQSVLVSLPAGKLIKNSGLFFFGFFPRTLVAAAVQCVYWGLVLLYLPYTAIALLVTGFWFPALIALLTVYPALEKAFHLEQAIREKRDAALDAALRPTEPRP